MRLARSSVSGIACFQPAAGEPASAGGIELVLQLALVERQLLLAQSDAPALIRALEEEPIAAALEHAGPDGEKLGSVSAHRFETGSLNELWPMLLGWLDAEELGDAPHLPRKIGLQVVVVDEKQVRPAPLAPIALLHLEPGIRWPALLLAGHRAPAEPEAEEFRGIGGDGWIRGGDGLVSHPRAAQPLEPHVAERSRVVVIGHRHVEPIARDMYVADLVIERQAVNRQVALQEAAVRLRFDARQHGLDRLGKTALDPGRDVPDRPRLGRGEDQQRHDP